MKSITKKIFALIIAVSMCLPATAARAISNDGEYNYRVLEDIISLYLETSLYETDRETLINQMLHNFLLDNPHMIGALANAALSTNDPYSGYYSATSSFMKDTSSMTYGIIIESRADNGKGEVFIKEVLEGSNAEFAGILPGDRFLSIEGMDVTGLSLIGIKNLLSYAPFAPKEKEASQWYQKFQNVSYSEEYEKFLEMEWDFTREVDIVFERTLHDGSKAKVQIALSKGLSSLKEIYYYPDEQNDTAVIQITSFNSRQSADKFKETVNAAIEGGLKNLVLDVRGNPGGYMELACSMADIFISGEKLIYYISSRAEQLEEVKSSGKDYIGDRFENIIVLTDSDTTSAAELFAFLLKDNANAVLIGETTFGKAVGQDIYSLANGDRFTITSLEILMPDKQSYNEKGLSPDIYVPVVMRKYDFPTGLSHFNHTNYVEIANGEKNDATLAFEQRLGIIGLLDEHAIDGVCDSSTIAATKLYQAVLLGQKNPDGVITYDMVSHMTGYINGYKDKYLPIDSQMDVAMLYLENNSRGKRLASEYVSERKKYDKMLEEKEEQNRIELEEYLKQEQQSDQ